ncbi:MAG: 23S rRNA pseudouridine(955/2504/2580) synthase [Beggiatoa sp. IS2]|nr:MAG: 23S rRNA pseudouridine(955/2504/2580) synthase [Beggiatoa sp. IS2]
MATKLSASKVAYLHIEEDQSGQRIDNFLQTYLKNVPKSHVYRILRTGQVRINGGRIKPTYRLQAGDRLRLPPLQQSTAVPLSPQPILAKNLLAKAILYEDDYLMVINKPAGMAVHGGSGISFGVIEGLRVLYPQLPHLELVHRLDRDTSGCLLITKKRSMLRQLHQLLREGKIHKHYFALVQGEWPPQLTQVNLPLQKNILQSGERVVRVNIEGKVSQSVFKIEQSFTIATLLRVQPLTGRTHQIRVHTAHQGHPIAGDEKYGNETFNQQMHGYNLHRLFLHATAIEFHLPESNYRLTVQTPLPTDLQQVLQQLRSTKE